MLKWNKYFLERKYDVNFSQQKRLLNLDMYQNTPRYSFSRNHLSSIYPQRYIALITLLQFYIQIDSNTKKSCPEFNFQNR